MLSDRQKDMYLHEKPPRIRGPLKVLQSPNQESSKLSRYDGRTKYQCDDELIISPEQLQTPFVRVTRRAACVRKKSLQSYPVPLDTSTCRIETSHLNNSPMNEDIRTHFPFRRLPTPNLYSENLFNECEKVHNHDNDNQSSSSYTTYTFQQGLRKNKENDRFPRKRVIATHDNLEIPAFNSVKRVCTCDRSQEAPSSETEEYANVQPAVNLAMGADVREHPRYQRRRSATSESASPVISRASLDRSYQRLSSICPVPMPTGFPHKLPTTYAAVTSPWDHVAKPASPTSVNRQKTAETQTSPAETNTSDKIKRNRRNSRSSLVLNSIRKTFGNLRRAISVDRLVRSSQDQEEVRTVTTRSSQSPVTKTNPNKTDSPITKQLGASEVVVAIGTQKHTGSSALSCHILNTWSDKSFRVVLRRSSTTVQFGFFIARDVQGIYISRLGSVRCAAALWDVLHVGDRILEVQGVSCSRLEVEDVQNLIRGCEIAEFRIKPSNSSFQPPVRL